MLQQGLKKGDSIVLHIPNSLEFYIFWLAACRSGAVSVPVDPRCSIPELRYIVDHSDARLVVTLEETLPSAKAASRIALSLPRIVTIR